MSYKLCKISLYLCAMHALFIDSREKYLNFNDTVQHSDDDDSLSVEN